MSNHDEREPDAGASPDEYTTDGRTGESYVGQEGDAWQLGHQVGPPAARPNRLPHLLS
jgi:hypothetical protein